MAMSDDNKQTTGWIVFAAAMGAMCTLMSAEIINLHTWNDATAPLFVGKALMHMGVVVASFVGGKLIPSK